MRATATKQSKAYKSVFCCCFHFDLQQTAVVEVVTFNWHLAHFITCVTFFCFVFVFVFICFFICTYTLTHSLTLATFYFLSLTMSKANVHAHVHVHTPPSQLIQFILKRQSGLLHAGYLCIPLPGLPRGLCFHCP